MEPDGPAGAVVVVALLGLVFAYRPTGETHILHSPLPLFISGLPPTLETLASIVPAWFLLLLSLGSAYASRPIKEIIVAVMDTFKKILTKTSALMRLLI